MMIFISVFIFPPLASYLLAIFRKHNYTVSYPKFNKIGFDLLLLQRKTKQVSHYVRKAEIPAIFCHFCLNHPF